MQSQKIAMPVYPMHKPLVHTVEHVSICVLIASGATKGGWRVLKHPPPSLSWGRPAIPPDPMTFCTG